jgi:hypothetical protein
MIRVVASEYGTHIHRHQNRQSHVQVAKRNRGYTIVEIPERAARYIHYKNWEYRYEKALRHPEVACPLV